MSCKKYGSPIKVLGFGEKWRGFNWRFKLVKEYIEKIPLTDIVCVVDGYDVICVKNMLNMIDDFKTIKKRENCKLIIGYDNLKYTNFFNRFFVKLSFGTYNGISLNAGTYIAEAEDMLNIIEELRCMNSNDSADDQVLLTKYANKNPGKLYIDINNELFLTIDVPYHDVSEYLEIKNNTVSYNDREPYFLHGPRHAYLDRVIMDIGIADNVNVKETIDSCNFIDILDYRYRIYLIIFSVILIIGVIYVINIVINNARK